MGRVAADPHRRHDAAPPRRLQVPRRAVDGEGVKDDAVAGLERPGQHLMAIELGIEVGDRLPRLLAIREGEEFLAAGQTRPEPPVPSMRSLEEAPRPLARHRIDRQPDRAHLPSVDAEIRLVLVPGGRLGVPGSLIHRTSMRKPAVAERMSRATISAAGESTTKSWNSPICWAAQ